MAEAEDGGRLLVSSHQLPDLPNFEAMQIFSPGLAEGMFELRFNVIITSYNYLVQYHLFPDDLSFCPHFNEIISDNLTS